jgi:Uncharacterized protein conserved in bacteria
MATKQLIVIFDANCMLCSNLARFLLKFQKAPTLQFLSLMSEEANILLTANNIPFNVNSIIVIDDKTTYTKSNAVTKIASKMVWWFFPLRLGLWLTPKFISNWVYDIVAKNRQLLWPQNKCVISKNKSQNFN